MRAFVKLVHTYFITIRYERIKQYIVIVLLQTVTTSFILPALGPDLVSLCGRLLVLCLSLSVCLCVTETSLAVNRMGVLVRA